MSEDKDGACTVFNEIKIANVFGQYTSLLTGISVTFPCDPENFEEKALGYNARITEAIKAFQDRTLVVAGEDKRWAGKTLATGAPAKRIGVKKGSAKKGSTPAARKRVPRKRS